MSKIKYTDTDIQSWIGLYEEIKSIRRVSEKFNIPFKTVYKEITKNGMIIDGNKKYTKNDNFFSIYTPESFYWAGFIAADGGVSKGSSCTLRIGLSTVDNKHLEKFKKCIDFNGPIKNNILKNEHHKSGLQYISVITINSRQIFEDLSKFNIVPNKTKTYTIPSWVIEHQFINHFLRGYVDGDGSFFTTEQSGQKHLNFNVVGNKQVLEEFKKIFIKNCGIKPNKITKSKNIFDLRWAGNRNCIKIRDYLYKNSYEDIYLERKYQKSHQELQIKPKNQYKFKKIKAISLDGIIIKYYDSIKQAAGEGFIYDCIWANCKKRQKQHRGFVWSYV